MTKEELKEEAEDYANNTRIKDKNTYISFNDERISELQDYEGNYMDISERIIKTYIDSAEPREKQIEKLESKLAEAEARLNYLNEFHSNCVEAFVSQSPRDDFEMACAGREIFELLYPDDERLKDIRN